jgi:hypothetical protein
MAYVREDIMARLLELAQGVSGISEAARNALDVRNLARPAITIRDGSETKLSQPRNQPRPGVQLMQTAPVIYLYVGAGQRDVGTLTNQYLARFLKSVLEDATLLSLVTTNGEISYEGANLEDPEAESREGRMEISLVFVYPFRASAL